MLVGLLALIPHLGSAPLHLLIQHGESTALVVPTVLDQQVKRSGS